MKAAVSSRELELMLAVFQRHPGIVEVRLFGSRAKGTHSDQSDFDLVVSGRLGALEVEALAAELDELPLPNQFDVLCMEEIQSDELRAHIKRVGQVIYTA